MKTDKYITKTNVMHANVYKQIFLIKKIAKYPNNIMI